MHLSHVTEGHPLRWGLGVISAAGIRGLVEVCLLLFIPLGPVLLQKYSGMNVFLANQKVFLWMSRWSCLSITLLRTIGVPLTVKRLLCKVML